MTQNRADCGGTLTLGVGTWKYFLKVTQLPQNRLLVGVQGERCWNQGWMMPSDDMVGDQGWFYDDNFGPLKPAKTVITWFPGTGSGVRLLFLFKWTLYIYMFRFCVEMYGEKGHVTWAKVKVDMHYCSYVIHVLKVVGLLFFFFF